MKGLWSQTFAILALKKLRIRYLNRSSSVCMTIRAKFVFGSMSPVISSTLSICALIRALTRSKKPSFGQLTQMLADMPQGGRGETPGRIVGRASCIHEKFWRGAFSNPGACQALQITRLLGNRVKRGVNLTENIVDVHAQKLFSVARKG